MIRPDPRSLQPLFPPMTEDFSRRMERLLRSLPATEEEKPVKHTLRTILICAVLLALLASTAFALTRPDVLRWLLGDRPASPQLEQTAQHIIGEGTADGITARITSLVFDGEQFAFAYELQSHEPTRPALVAFDRVILLNGKEASLSYATADPYSPQMLPSPHLDILPVRRNPAVGGGWSSRISDALTGPVECEMTLIIYRPVKGFAVLLDPEDMRAHPEQYDPQTQAEIEDSLNTLRSFPGTIIAEDSPETEAAYLAQGYTIVRGSGAPRYTPGDERSHLRESARITVTFTFDASNALAHDFSGKSADLPDCRVEAVSFRLTPLETFFNVYLIPEENTREAAQALAARHGPWALLDEDGQPVQYSEMDSLYSLTPDVAQIDWQWVCRYIESMPGLLTFPEEVVFATDAGELLRFPINGTQ